jgi:hypothetical protein
MLHAIAGPCATLADLREGTYLSGQGKLWYVLGALGDESVVIEDCALPDEPECLAADAVPGDLGTARGREGLTRPIV